MRPKWILSVAAALTMAAPVPASAQFGGRPSPEQQIKLGQQAAAQLRQKEKVLPSSDARVQALRRVASRILSTFPAREPWQYSFDVVDSKQVNAFALPGGPTFFYTGLMDKLKTEDELAGVLGHELTHVRQQHWATHYASAQKRDLLLSLGLLVFHANRGLAEGVGLLDNFLDLRYSRGDEDKADRGGYSAMTAAGYNPNGMIDLFKLLEAQQRGGLNVEFLSDHPSDASRIRRIESLIANGRQNYPPQRPVSYPTPGR